MAMQDKIIAGIMLVHGSLGILWTFWVASQIGFPAAFIAANLALAAIGIAAGIGWLKRRRWAAYVAIAFFLVQLVHVLTSTFQWSFTLGFNLNVSLGWLSRGELGLNLFALVMLLWSSARAFAPNNSFKPNPLRGSA
ncbi:hypothetical protein NCPPB1935_10205 [Xanthomonas campestris pv. nigromaculans]|uniref:hypothetical protein n=1 Tax=Xanthomonas hortorum TaxID=56454 RepID=UPI001E508EBC|nr:hypothetical protein [Xanthomonas hortorum]MCC4625174.1 hypothetical protein [Xanthomonas campestris pv. nigromaculans]MCC8554891.1 hypothetical protein [Xanthomonas hortorum pv. gardneri]MCE4364521.1 hypothetical protein [Xanthomonas hortorum]CAH2708129.1 hypothetical protein NCPPB1935_10205 [Xanthomonas campestris pv. nigromaculans]